MNKAKTPKVLIQAKKKAEFLLEMKLHYPQSSLKRSRKRQEVESKVFVYMPNQLLPHAQKENEERFLRECLSSHIRFTTPLFSLDKLLDAEILLDKIYALLQGPFSRTNKRRLSTLLRLFCCVFSRSLKRSLYKLRKSLFYYIKQSDSSEKSLEHRRQLIEKIDKQVSAIERLGPKLDTLRAHFFDDAQIMAHESRVDLNRSDEFLSQHLVIDFSQLYKRVSCFDETPETSKVLEKVKSILNTEYRYRAAKDYLPLPVSDDFDVTEAWITMRSRLKKWTQTVLYLKIANKRTPEYLFQMFASFSAAIAMTFAILTQVYATKTYGSLSLAWIIMMIVSYIFKDRIKEILRGVLATLPNSAMASYEYADIKDQADHSSVGKLKSFVRYQEMSTLSDTIVRETLQDDPRLLIEDDHKVIVYWRKLRFKQKDSDLIPFVSSFTDILLFNLTRYAERMDESIEYLDFCSPEGEVSQHKGYRLYSVHFFIRLLIDDQLYWQHYNVTMTHKEIIRVEGQKLTI